MKAPKKIYLAESDRYKGEVTSTFASSYPIGGGGNIEYIRKDALLEWMEGQLETLKPLLDTDPYKEAYIGKCEAFKEVIDKLNSM